MTIYELEKRSGVARPNIRFYEKEGLIAPKRLANGYRDYSEEDALALEKIVLLRRLDLPLEDIRRARNGEVPLGLALEKHEEALAIRQKETEQALRVSRAIRKDGASYQTLQPEKYKAQLPPSKPPVLPNEPKHYATRHPWRRFFARQLDSLLFALPGLAALELVNLLRPEMVFLLTILAIWLLEAVLEGLFLSLLGTTPGKWLMGLCLRYRYDDRVDKPAFRDAALRAAHVWFRGCGLGLFPQVCGAFSYLRANRGDEQPWDYDWEYTAGEYIHEIRAVALAAALLLATAGFGWALDWQETRIGWRQEEARQREIACAEYINSVNLIFAYHWELAEYRDVGISPDGTFTGREELAQYDLTITVQEETFQSAVLTGPDNEMTSALANGLFLGLLEARNAGDGLKWSVLHLADGNFRQVGNWCMDYSVKEGIATVTIEKTDETFWYS